MKKSLITRKFTTVVLLAVTMAFGTVNASAVPLDGTIGFGGLFTPTGGTDLSDATGLSFGFNFVSTASGDFLPALTQTATFSPFDFDPASTPVVTPLWVVDAYSFDLNEVFVTTPRSATQLFLNGTGTLMAAGFDDTPGDWTFSGNEFGGILFTFSSIATTVAEPGSAFLLGLGLIGMGIVRRRLNG